MCERYENDVLVRVAPTETQATTIKGVLEAALWMLENVGWAKKKIYQI